MKCRTPTFCGVVLGVCAKAEQPCPFGIGERIKAQRRGGNLAGAPKMGRPRPQNRGAKTLHLVRKHGRNRTGCARDLCATQGGLEKKEFQARLFFIFRPIAKKYFQNKGLIHEKGEKLSSKLSSKLEHLALNFYGVVLGVWFYASNALFLRNFTKSLHCWHHFTVTLG